MGMTHVSVDLDGTDLFSPSIHPSSSTREGSPRVWGAGEEARKRHGKPYRREDGMGTPWTGQQSIRKGQGEPVGREEVGRCRSPEGPRRVRLQQTVNDDDANNWPRRQGVSVVLRG